jgi:hypothetical protein
LGPKWYTPNGSMPFHRAQKILDFQGPSPSHVPLYPNGDASINYARGLINHRSINSWFVFVQEAKKCFEEALERATAEAEEDEKYYKLIAITIRSESVTVLYPLFKGTVA